MSAQNVHVYCNISVKTNSPELFNRIGPITLTIKDASNCFRQVEIQICSGSLRSLVELNFRFTGHGPHAKNGGARRAVLLGRRLGFTVSGHRLSGGSGKCSAQVWPDHPFHWLSLYFN